MSEMPTNSSASIAFASMRFTHSPRRRARGATSGTITVQLNGDRIAEPNETYFVNLSNPNYGVITHSQGVGTIIDDDTKFYVVNDAAADKTFEYGSDGAAGESYNLGSGDTAPRGAASEPEERPAKKTIPRKKSPALAPVAAPDVNPAGAQILSIDKFRKKKS